MLTPSYFADPVRQAQLLFEANSWLATPFVHRGRVKGAGADCVTLTGEIMVACGVIDSYEFPRYSLDWAKHQTRSLVLEWLEACPRVVRLPGDEAPAAGDVGCYQYGKCVHHCAVVLAPPVLIHTVLHDQVDLGRLDDSSLTDRLVCYYRPLPR